MYFSILVLDQNPCLPWEVDSVSSELGACEWFVWDLRKSGLIDRGQLDQVIGDYLRRNPRAEPPALAEFLVQQKIISPYQSDRILQGKTQGLVLGPFVLVDAIGQGSMGQVYKAQSKTDNNWYAIKVLPRRSMWNVRLARRQVRSFSQFSHPAIVPFVDVGTSGGLHYLAWPLVQGKTLEHIISEQGKFLPEDACRIVMQIAQALAIAHSNQVFHGLLKPSNIMVEGNGAVHILDFGIGSLLAENDGAGSMVDTMSTANTLTSGLDCASPESIMDPTNRTPAGDQYSLGCILYFCLAGRYPFPDGTAVEKMMAHQMKEPVSVQEFAPDVPTELSAIITRLMQKDPAARYHDSEEVVAALQPFSGGMAMTMAPIRRGSGLSNEFRPASTGSREIVAPVAPAPAPMYPTGNSSSPIGISSAPMPASTLGRVESVPMANSMPQRSSVAVPNAAPPRPMVAAVPFDIPDVDAPLQPIRPIVPQRPQGIISPSTLPNLGNRAALLNNLPALPSPSTGPMFNSGIMDSPVIVPSSGRGDMGEDPNKRNLNFTLVLMVACLVTVAVYLLGKNWLGGNP
jgi:serine/threonine protein kinase